MPGRGGNSGESTKTIYLRSNNPLCPPPPQSGGILFRAFQQKKREMKKAKVARIPKWGRKELKKLEKRKN